MGKTPKSEELNVLMQMFNNLSASDKKTFLDSLNKSEDRDNILETIKAKEINACPHCKSIHFVKNGTKNGTQRYLCRDCKKSFVTESGTILYRTQKDIEVWKKYIHCMINKYPLRKCAKECDITLYTAFIWRHKILDALQNMMNEVELDGIVEADETFTTISYKGNHKNFKLPRKAHQRGTKASKRGLSREQVCIPCGVNLNGLSIAKISNLGRPGLRDIQKVLGNRIKKDSVFVTDSLRAYQKLSFDMELNHIRIPRNKRSVGTFNIQVINNYHARLKDLIICRFKGVATKYLNNYLVYHNFVNFSKETEDEKESILLKFISETGCNTRTYNLSKRNPVPLLN